MLKQLLNECLVTLHLVPEGPMLVKSGIASLTGPDMGFVRVWRNGTPEVYLPGSSIKGVLRSHAERIARTIGPEETIIACDPFKKEGPEAFCGHCFENRDHQNPHLSESFRLPDPDEKPDEINQAVYRDSCPICRLFGSTRFAGRLATADAYAVGPAPAPQTRDGVGIDRFTGGAAERVKFDLEVITGGRFATSLHIRNFELWQLGLVGFLLQDLKDGLLRIGAGKSRGLGKVKAEITQVDLHYLGRARPVPPERKFLLCGIGGLAGKAITLYGLASPHQIEVEMPTRVTERRNAIRTTYTFTGDTFPWTALAETWVNYATRYEEPPAMRHVRSRA